MTSTKKFLTALGFLLLLLALGSADALLTRGTLHFPTDGGVGKKLEPDVVAIAQATGFSVTDSGEEFLLQKIVPPGTVISSHVLLRNNDRAGAIGWVESGEVKTTFRILKEKLRSSFSTQLKDLIDETQTEAGKPPRDILSFHDPAILGDRVVFARVRQRLYEFHVTAGKEADMNALVDALTE